jgi:hypothetical protein
MRAFVLLLFFVLAFTARAAEPSNDDVDELSPPGGHGDRLQGIDDDIQKESIDPDEELDEPEFADPYADDPDADETLPEDRPDADPDAEPTPLVEPADMLDPLPDKKRSKMYPNVLESPLKDSPLKDGDDKDYDSHSQ